MRQDIINLKEQALQFETLYVVEGYATFRVFVRSGDFSGANNFCASLEKIKSTIQNLTIMYQTLKGECEMDDYDSDSFLKFELDKYGHLHISGQIGGTYDDHYMKFKFSSDQTVLEQLIRTLKSI